MEPLQHLIVTGASGFLGTELVSRARNRYPALPITAFASPRKGGIDLSHPGNSRQIRAALQSGSPGDAVLIHAAAVVRPDAPSGPSANLALTQAVAEAAQSLGVGFCILVSSVSVYAPSSITALSSRTEPAGEYGASKLAAEKIWETTLSLRRRAIVRMAGIWGWQQVPTLFWNQILLAAGRGSPPERIPVVHRKNSLRNYISASEASDCLLGIAAGRAAGTFLAAGRDVVSMESFVRSVQSLRGSRLTVDWRDDEGCDQTFYQTSAELMPWLTPFEKTLGLVWEDKPGWLLA